MVLNRSNTLFCIFNYKDNSNAEYLYSQISPYYVCRIIDCDSGIRPNLFGGDTICLPNVYYGGMMHKAIELAREGDCDFLFFICSDVRMDEMNLRKMLSIIQNEDFKNVGVYSPSHCKESYTMPCWGYCMNKDKKRKVPFVEGMMSLYKREVYEMLYPCVENKHGWGIDVAASFFAKKLNLVQLIDDRIQIYHPMGDRKKRDTAYEQMVKYFEMYKEKEQLLEWIKVISKYKECVYLQRALMKKDYYTEIRRMLFIMSLLRIPKRLCNRITKTISSIRK